VTEFVFAPPTAVTHPVEDGHAFPVRRVFCVGRNYAEHAREMGNDAREAPFFFCKPANAVVTEGGAVPYPSQTQDLHHEIELVVAIGPVGRGDQLAGTIEGVGAVRTMIN
jgi:fumarylpyruvate hydrolase